MTRRAGDISVRRFLGLPNKGHLLRCCGAETSCGRRRKLSFVQHWAMDRLQAVTACRWFGCRPHHKPNPDPSPVNEQDVGEVKSAAVEAHRKLKREENARVICVEVAMVAVVAISVDTPFQLLLPASSQRTSFCPKRLKDDRLYVVVAAIMKCNDMWPVAAPTKGRGCVMLQIGHCYRTSRRILCEVPLLRSKVLHTLFLLIVCGLICL